MTDFAPDRTTAPRQRQAHDDEVSTRATSPDSDRDAGLRTAIDGAMSSGGPVERGQGRTVAADPEIALDDFSYGSFAAAMAAAGGTHRDGAMITIVSQFEEYQTWRRLEFWEDVDRVLGEIREEVEVLVGSAEWSGELGRDRFERAVGAAIESEQRVADAARPPVVRQETGSDEQSVDGPGEFEDVAGDEHGGAIEFAESGAAGPSGSASAVPEHPDDPDMPQSLGTARDGALPLEARRVAIVTMNQGLVADLQQLSFNSTDFSTCSPLAMYNSATHRGGLFHFPGNGLDGSESEKVERRLRQMYDDVSPTTIWVNARSVNNGYGALDQMSDVPSLRRFFSVDLGSAATIVEVHARGNEYSFFLDALDQPQVVVGAIPGVGGRGMPVFEDRSREERAALAERWRDLPAATKYGVDEYSHLAGGGSY